MRRRLLHCCARQIAETNQCNTFAYWTAKTFPEVFQQTWNGQTVNVEFNLLENTSEYLHIGIAVDDGGWLSSHWPVTTSIIIRKSTPTG
jgi:hypothetical protein